MTEPLTSQDQIREEEFSRVTRRLAFGVGIAVLMVGPLADNPFGPVSIVLPFIGLGLTMPIMRKRISVGAFIVAEVGLCALLFRHGSLLAEGGQRASGAGGLGWLLVSAMQWGGFGICAVVGLVWGPWRLRVWTLSAIAAFAAGSMLDFP